MCVQRKHPWWGLSFQAGRANFQQPDNLHLYEAYCYNAEAAQNTHLLISLTKAHGTERETLSKVLDRYQPHHIIQLDSIHPRDD